MISVRLCNPVAEQPFDHFVDTDHTLYYVRVPKGSPIQVGIRVSDPGFVACIEADGEPQMNLPLVPGNNRVQLMEQKRRLSLPALQGLSDLVLSGGGSARNLSGASAGQDAPGRRLVVAVHRGTEEGPVEATFTFALLDDATFAQLQTEHLDAADGQTVTTTDFTPDHTLAGKHEKCFNCSKPLAAGACCPDCGCPQV